MPVFSQAAIESEAEGLARLHEILHGRSAQRRSGTPQAAAHTAEARVEGQAGKRRVGGTGALQRPNRTLKAAT